MADIKIKNGEIFWGDEGCQLIDGAELLIQDLHARLTADKGTLFYAPSYGAGLLRFLHGSLDDTSKLALKAVLLLALQEEERIQKDSEEVEIFEEMGSLGACIRFIFVETGEEIYLKLLLGGGLTLSKEES